MDDLTKPKFGSLRFMRQAYKDPMNKKDGEWRLIYVGPTGQLIGSLKPPQTLQLSGLAGGGGALPGTPAAQLGAQSAGQTAGQTFGQAVGQIFGNSSAAAQSAPSNSANQPNTAGSANSGTDANATSTDAPGTTPDTSDPASEALLSSDPIKVMGGNIIGVGSTVNQRSIIAYEKAKNYKQFEFIWDPSKDAIVLGGAAGPQIGTPAGQPSNSSPFGQSNDSNPNSPGSPLNPQPNPPETTPAPPQQP
jgi:hypothetical protein